MNPTQVAINQHFTCRKFLQDDEVFGARWWHEGFAESQKSDKMGRRSAVRTLLVLGGAVGLLALTPTMCRCTCGDDEKTVAMEALSLQQKNGWNVGEEDTRLTFEGSMWMDVEHGLEWKKWVDKLNDLLFTRNPKLMPFHVGTLLQAPSQPLNASLTSQLTPIHSDDMDRALAAGEGLRQQFEALQPFPTETAVLLDLPGPAAVAAAAGLAPRFDPIPLFDNWPHPRGVVPSHEVLAAILYYAPRFAAARDTRPADAPPAFILDASRLRAAPSWDRFFDNRYMARLPSADSFKGLGIKHVLYVIPQMPPAGRPVEQDDLNDDFVALGKAGIDVKVVALDDLQRMVALIAAQPPVAAGSTTHTHYYYHPTTVWFWHSYGWYSPPSAPRGSVAPMPSTPPPSGATYTPAPRSTIFSTRAVGGLGGVGKQRPSGFGLVSARTDSRGSFSTWASGTSRRSGSLGRSRSSFSG